MQYLTSINQCATQELEAELKAFFVRLRHIKTQLQREGKRLHLNRQQRSRCRENLLTLSQVEQEFNALTYREDLRDLYRNVHRYVKLDHDQLIELFGHESVPRTSLFVIV